LRLDFVKFFVLVTFWLGTLGGAVLLWQRGSRWADVLCGAMAGTFAGLAGAATGACLLDVIDGLPRLVLALIGRMGKLPESGGPWAGTVVWVVLAVLCWGLLGGAAGFLLAWAGRAGQRLIEIAAAPFAWAFRTCGLGGAAAFFTL
jgi:hypothetical protein